MQTRIRLLYLQIIERKEKLESNYAVENYINVKQLQIMQKYKF